MVFKFDYETDKILEIYGMNLSPLTVLVIQKIFKSYFELTLLGKNKS